MSPRVKQSLGLSQRRPNPRREMCVGAPRGICVCVWGGCAHTSLLTLEPPQRGASLLRSSKRNAGERRESATAGPGLCFQPRPTLLIQHQIRHGPSQSWGVSRWPPPEKDLCGWEPRRGRPWRPWEMAGGVRAHSSPMVPAPSRLGDLVEASDISWAWCHTPGGAVRYVEAFCKLFGAAHF